MSRKTQKILEVIAQGWKGVTHKDKRTKHSQG